ncbi:MAG: cytochrome c oxidase subunit II [Acidobacteria bacterium]|nr:cytochrome c oxidase subunit II [Acidobacteriota bacterium]
MWSGFPLFPETASTVAGRIDNLYFFLVSVTAFFTLLIFLLVFIFALKYRRKSETERPRPITGSFFLEFIWIGVPLVITLIMFTWGAVLYFDLARPPKGALDIYVVGKQWMWKVQHPTGQREINELHIPINRPVRLTMATEDVIHSFYIPAFRIKKDVEPGKYSTLWFEATQTGEFHLFCAEYCGTRHSLMGGKVVALEPKQYQAWLSGGAADETLEEAGARLFQQLGCVTCHRADSGARGPALEGKFGKPVLLSSGETVIFDEAYTRESILNPRSKIVAGYPTVMPTFQGQISEEGLLQLIAFIKSLTPRQEGNQ